MITIHHLGISQSDRIVWLCEELGIPYDLKLYARDPVTRGGPAEYKALHPFGTAPVIEDGDLMLGESGAIIEYICAKYGDGRLIPGINDPSYPNHLFWFHFANGSLMPAAMTEMIAMRFVPDTTAIMPLLDRASRAYAMIEDRLGKADYFAGDSFTTADIMMMFPLTTMRLFAPRDISGFPNLLAYLQRIGARPAFQRAAAKADPDLVQQLS